MLKKLGIAVAACTCSLLIAVGANAATVSKGNVTADALNVRTLPSTSGTSLGLIPYNTEVTIYDTQDNWYQIYYANQKAYISADYVTITQTNVVETPQPAQAPAVPVSTGWVPSYAGSAVPGEALVEICKQYIGTPYVYGGMSPEGFDCSGFVKYCYSLMGVEINRIACDQALNGYEVATDQMLPGDILCFADSSGNGTIGHTGIYVGNGYFIHSPRTGYTVEIVSLSATSYGNRIKNVRRIF